MRLSGLLSIASLVLVAAAHANPAGNKVFARISGLKPPSVDQSRLQDTEYRNAYSAKVTAYTKERNELILELYRTDPEHPQILKLLEERWQRYGVGQSGNSQERLLAEIQSVRESSKQQAVKDLADYEETAVRVRSSNSDADTTKLIDGFFAKHPKDPHGESLLLSRAFQLPDDKRAPLFGKYLEYYPAGKYVAMVKGVMRQKDGIGKPFALAFNDAVSGAKVDVDQLKGKVVLVDFWATWCGPCVAKMPEVKRWYNEYRPKGLAVIGVSLDNPEAQGGLTKLKAFVAKNSIPWPQYYQGNGWESTFSAGWGIMSIPCTFLVDKKGVLREINPANEVESIKKLLAE